MEPIIPFDRSIVIACDTDLTTYRRILETTSDLDIVGAYKIGAELALGYGLQRVMELTHHFNFMSKPLIYDHQAGGNDISSVEKKISRRVRDAGFEAIIFKPKKQKLEGLIENIQNAQDVGLNVMVVGKMTDEKFDENHTVDDAMKIYETAFEEGVSNFGVPGNDLEFLEQLKSFYEGQKISYFPIGIGVQGGNLPDVSKVFDYSPIHPIIGRRIYESKDIGQASKDLFEQIS